MRGIRLAVMAIRRRAVSGRGIVWRSDRLTKCAVELGRHLTLTIQHRMRRDERLCLLVDRGEDAFLREPLAVAATTILGLVEPGASNL